MRKIRKSIKKFIFDPSICGFCYGYRFFASLEGPHSWGGGQKHVSTPWSHQRV